MSLQQPERVMTTRCNHMVEGNPMSYPCTRAQGHEETGEPHYAVENARSVRAWQAWKADQDKAATQAVERLGSFHEAARTPTLPVASGGALFDEQAIQARRQDKGYMDCSEACLLQGHTQEEGCILATPTATPPVSDVVVDLGSDEPVPTKQRQGDQVIPDGDESQPDIQSLVISDVEQRRQVGIERYGQGLRPFNGRDTLLDTYEEALDLTTYLRSLLEMQMATRDRLREVVRADVVAVLEPVFGWQNAQMISENLAERVTTRIVDSFAFPGKAPDEVIAALGRITTQTRVSPEVRIEAGKIVQDWLQGR